MFLLTAYYCFSMSLLHIRPLPKPCSIFSLGTNKEWPILPGLTLSYVILGITAYVFY